MDSEGVSHDITYGLGSAEFRRTVDHVPTIVLNPRLVLVLASEGCSLIS